MPSPAQTRRVLFLCHLNRSRSATAERLFCKRTDLQVCSAGTSEDALVRVSEPMLDWADLIFTMDLEQRQTLERLFPGHAALDRVVCLDIPDAYVFLQPDLVRMLEERVPPHLGDDTAHGTAR